MNNLSKYIFEKLHLNKDIQISRNHMLEKNDRIIRVLFNIKFKQITCAGPEYYIGMDDKYIYYKVKKDGRKSTWNNNDFYKSKINSNGYFESCITTDSFRIIFLKEQDAVDFLNEALHIIKNHQTINKKILSYVDNDDLTLINEDFIIKNHESELEKILIKLK